MTFTTLPVMLLMLLHDDNPKKNVFIYKKIKGQDSFIMFSPVFSIKRRDEKVYIFKN